MKLLLFFLFLHCALFKKVTGSCPPLSCGELCSNLWGYHILVHYLEFYLETCLFPIYYLFMYPTIDFHHNELMDIYSMLCVIIQCYLILLLKLSHLDLCQLIPDSFWLSSSMYFLKHFLTFSTTRHCCRLNSFISCPYPKITHFSNEPWFFSLENGMRNQVLDARSAPYSWVLLHLGLSV